MSHLRTPREKNRRAAVLRLESLEDRSVPAPFTAGNVVVYRVGDGAAAMTSGAATAVFLDEYTPTGSLVQAVGLPTADSGSNQQLTSNSTATTEGFLTLSTDGRFLIVPGYDAAPGTASVSSSSSATISRVIGRVGAGGAIDTSTTTTSFSGGNIRGATSTNGTDLWASGANTGLVYTTLGATDAGTVVSTTLTNLRAVSIFDGQLYISTQFGSSIRIGSVGTGTPTTSGQTITNIPGGPTSGAFNGFFFADLSGSVAGVDTLYVADESDSTIQKYALVSGSWTARGTVVATSVLGLTGVVSGTTVTLFGTTGGSGTSGGGTLYKFTDATGYNANVSGTVMSLATAAANTAFRGVAFAPQVGTPTVTNATTNEDIQTASGLVISASDANDGATHYKITGITNGTLFQNNGTTAIANGTFITKAEGAAGLKFTPALNQFGNNLGSFGVQASTNNLDSGLGGSVVTTNITVNPVADTPLATIAITDEDTQSTSGLVLTPNPVDSTEVTHFKITNIQNGTLFQNNGTTTIANGDFITVAQGDAGLKFTPASNFFGTGSFDVQGGVGNTGSGLSSAATATVVVNAVPTSGQRFIVAGSDAGTSSVVRVLDVVTLSPQFDLLAYDGYLGGVRVAQGDVNGDGTNDIITATAADIGHVKVFDGVTGAEIRSFMPFGAFPSGLSVASGDINGDGFADIVVGITNGPAHVQAFDGRTGEPLQSYIAYDGFLGGVRVAVGDVNGDGRDDITTVAGPGGNGHVKVFDGLNLGLQQSYLSYGGYQGEINLAVGDVTGDGQGEVVTTALAAQGGTHLKAIGVGGLEVASFFAPTIDDTTTDVVGSRRAAAPSGATEPARVSVADVNGDGVAEILLGSAPGAGPSQLVLLNAASQTVLDRLFAFDPNFALGVYVG